MLRVSDIVLADRLRRCRAGNRRPGHRSCSHELHRVSREPTETEPIELQREGRQFALPGAKPLQLIRVVARKLNPHSVVTAVSKPASCTICLASWLTSNLRPNG